MKVLVAIASYGRKNLPYLLRSIESYRSMQYEIDIVVHSNERLELGNDIQIVVGIPFKNRMAMPFAHKKLFIERRNSYDLYIYGEDDVLISHKNIEAFLQVSNVLPKNQIPGFFRFELDQKGKRYYPDVFHSFHFDPSSVYTRAGLVFAQFTNEHAGCYMMTRYHLEKAIQTKGYDLGLRSGPYSIACTASTDPYRNCNMNKVICVSRFEDFLVHHLPNKFVGKVGICDAELVEQLRAIKDLAASKRKGKYLFNVNTSLRSTYWWNKSYFETCSQEIITKIARTSRKVLSIGCGYGVWESQLVKKGVKVTGIPLDSIVGQVAQKKGIEITDPDFNIAKKQLAGTVFDCLVFVNVLHRLYQPWHVLYSLSTLLGEAGSVVATMPNFHHLPLLAMRWGFSRKRSPRFIHSLAEDARWLGKFKKSRLHLVTPAVLQDWFKYCKLEPIEIRYKCEGMYRKLDTWTLGFFGRLLGNEIVGMGRRVR